MNGNYAITANFELIPPPPADQRLIGESADGVGNITGNWFTLGRFAALATGKVTEIKVYSRVNGNVKIAIYADSAGEPGARLSYNNTGQSAVANQWNTLTIPELSITKDTYYWLAFNADANGVVAYTSLSGGTFREKVATYSSFTYPDPAGTGFSGTGNNVSIAIAGWGIAVVPEKPVAPTRDCTALTFRWNASTGATNYHLQVNTNAAFTDTDMFNDEVGNVTSREVTGLTAGTTYYYRIKAGNAGGWSGWSSTGSMRCGAVIE